MSDFSNPAGGQSAGGQGGGGSPEPRRQESNNSYKLFFISLGIFLLTKLKSIFALLKFSKFGGTIISMAVSVGAYALIYPWQFAIGFVLLIFVHELGHVWAAKLKGQPVSAPMFIPFLGALITLKRHPRDAVTEAYIAFGGPLIGSIGAWAVGLAGVMTQSGLLLSLGYVGVFLNLINLLPIHPLDGGRISVAVTRWLWLAGLIGGLWIIIEMGSILFFLIWAMFAYELYQKFVKYRNRKKPFRWETGVRVPVHPDQSYWIPGESHRSRLPVVTYSMLDEDREQRIELEWAAIGLKETLRVPQQILVDEVEVAGVRQKLDMNGQLAALDVTIVLTGRQYEAEDYYDVPNEVRIAYGTAYVILAAALGYSMFWLGDQATQLGLHL